MYMNAYHKVQGEVRMFEVDARNAIARFPAEWSASPWSENEGALSATAERGRSKKIVEPPLTKVTEEAGNFSAADGGEPK